MCNDNIRLPPELETVSFGMLHAHSNYSDFYGRMEDAIVHAKEIGLDAYGITDHGTCAGFIDHLQTCKQHDIKPILGLEGYFRLPSIDKRFHITILANGTTQSYEQIIKLNNASHTNLDIGKKKNFPIITLEMIEEYCGPKSGITVLTGCVSSAIHYEHLDVAEAYVENLIRYCGIDNVKAEIMDTLETMDSISRPLHMVEKFGIRPIFTADCHMIKKEQEMHQRIMNMMRYGYAFDSGDLHIHSKEDAWNVVSKKLPRDLAIESIVNIGEFIDNAEIPDVQRDAQLPDVSNIKEQFYTSLNTRLEEDLDKRPEQAQLRLERFNKELTILEEKGFVDYFVLVGDIVDFARSQNITVSARGSCAGSYISFLLGISIPDPIDNGLIFERFINYQRNDPPDADIDLPSSRREEVIEYAKKKYGVEQVATFLTFSHKSLTKSIARGLDRLDICDIPSDIVNKASEMGPKSKEFKEFSKYSPYIQEMYDDLLGTIDTSGSHACAVVSLQSDIVVPLECHKGTVPLVSYVESGLHKSLQLVGGTKIDLLGIEGLSLLDDMEKLSGVKPPLFIQENDKCYTLFDTRDVNGIFQMSSEVGRDICEKMPIRSMMDITIATSLNRPAALDSGSHISFLENSVPDDFWPDFLKPVVAETRGVMVFQETLMAVTAEICAESNASESEKMAFADIARKIIIPKTVRLLDDPKWIKSNNELKEKFWNGGRNKGLTESKIQEIWDLLASAARYGFVKAHANSYAWLASQQLWYKYYHPEVYYAAQLRNTGATASDLEDNLNFMIESVSNNLDIVPPHVNLSSHNYELKDKQLYLPLRVIKGLGEKSANEIIDNGKYKNMTGLATLSNKTVRRKLFEINALSGLEGDLYDLGCLSVKIKKITYQIKPNQPTHIELQPDDEVYIRINKIGKDGILPTVNSIKLDQIPIADKQYHRYKVDSSDIVAKSSRGTQFTIQIHRTEKEEYPELLDKKQAMKHHLGFVLPNKNTAAYIKNFSNIENQHAGYIVDRYTKVSNKGNVLEWYKLTGNVKVFYCIETKSSKWINSMRKQGVRFGGNVPDLNPGDFVKIETSDINQLLNWDVLA